MTSAALKPAGPPPTTATSGPEENSSSTGRFSILLPTDVKVCSVSQTNKPSFDKSLADGVHVWTVYLNSTSPEEFSALRACLNEAEIARACRFHFERDQRHFSIARGWLRRLLSRYLHVPGEEIAFDYGARGKPGIRSPATELRFNVSHSHGRALFAFAQGREVGIDVEAGARLGDDWRGLVRRVFSEREQAELLALPAGQQRAGFLNGWTRKEAYLKATGLGIVAGLQSIEVTLGSGNNVELLAGPAGTDWSLRDLRSDGDFATALVVEGRLAVEPTRFDCAADY